MSEPVHCRTMRVHSHHLHIFGGATVQCDGVGGEVEEMARQALEAKPPLATRIPAAIKRAEELLDDEAHADGVCLIDNLTATEVTLAEALWDLWTLAYGDADEFDDPWKAALIAFTEKIEGLA